MNPRDDLHLPRNLIDRVLRLQQRFFGSLPFGPLFLAVTAWWAGNAVHLGWDHSGLPILTFLLSELAIYMSWVVTNILNRTSARDKRRDDLEAEEVHRLFGINQRQLSILLEQTALSVAQHDAILSRLTEVESRLPD